jgi:hypothetical protein
MTQVVEYLPRKCNVLSSKSSDSKKKMMIVRNKVPNNQEGIL